MLHGVEQAVLALAPTPQDYQVAYNIDGTITQQPSLPKVQADNLINFVKNLQIWTQMKKRKPQKGIFKLHKHNKLTLSSGKLQLQDPQQANKSS